MIYTDNELFDWWKKLSEFEKEDLFLKMMTRAPSETFAEFAESLRDQWSAGKDLSAKQLTSIRKWWRE